MYNKRTDTPFLIGSGLGNPGMPIKFPCRLLRSPSLLCLITVVLLFGVGLTALNVWELRRLQTEHFSSSHTVLSAEADATPGSGRPIVWVKAKNPDSGYLDHVFKVFHRIGFMRGSQESKWDVAWHHDYPFMVEEFRPIFMALQPHQKVNHIPGSGFYTSKVNLATTNVSGIPPAFQLPEKREIFLSFAKQHPETFWVQKNNNHRGIVIKQVADLDLKQEESFVQEYISKPLLVDARKFDIGVYVVVTSVLPLRVYVYEGDYLLRFCPQDYHPFDPKIVDKYVVGDDYTPTWKIPSLEKYYTEAQLGHKESLSVYLRSKKMDSDALWSRIRQTIRGVFIAKAPAIRPLLEKYPNGGRNFFELSRFDFVVDEDLNPYLMEANMSPNLSSGHFPPNKLIYEQVLWNLLSLVGVARHIHSESLKHMSTEELNMQVSDQDLQVYSDICTNCNSCGEFKCKLCQKCVSTQHRQMLKDSYLEHYNRLSMRRVIPEPKTQQQLLDEKSFLDQLKLLDSEEDQLIAWWFRGKCLVDSTWCH